VPTAEQEAELQEMLSRHVFDTRAFSKRFVDGDQITSLAGTTYNVSIINDTISIGGFVVTVMPCIRSGHLKAFRS
jgi:hypothetical protein